MVSNPLNPELLGEEKLNLVCQISSFRIICLSFFLNVKKSLINSEMFFFSIVVIFLVISGLSPGGGGSYLNPPLSPLVLSSLWSNTPVPPVTSSTVSSAAALLQKSPSPPKHGSALSCPVETASNSRIVLPQVIHL